MTGAAGPLFLAAAAASLALLINVAERLVALLPRSNKRKQQEHATTVTASSAEHVRVSPAVAELPVVPEYGEPPADADGATGGSPSLVESPRLTQCPPSHAMECPVPTADLVGLCALQVASRIQRAREAAGRPAAAEQHKDDGLHTDTDKRFEGSNGEVGGQMSRILHWLGTTADEPIDVTAPKHAHSCPRNIAQASVPQCRVAQPRLVFASSTDEGDDGQPPFERARLWVSC
jgi:hypothetical protein